MKKILFFALFICLNGYSQCWENIAGKYRHHLAIKEDGTLWAWGRNSFGQLGDGSTINKSEPVQIGTESDWESVAAGEDHTTAIKTNGTLWIWGRTYLGLTAAPITIEEYHTPQQVGLDNDWRFVAEGNSKICVIKDNGTLWCWGRYIFANTPYTFFPEQIGSDNDWAFVSASYNDILAIKNNHTLWGWGKNTYGNLGIGSNTENYNVTQVGTASNWATVSLIESHTLATKTDGTLWSWGTTALGGLGLGSMVNSTYVPMQVGSNTNWIIAKASDLCSYGITANAELSTWGYNSYGQLCDGDGYWGRDTPGLVSGYWENIFPGTAHAMGLKDGLLVSVGSNAFGQLANGTTLDSQLPTALDETACAGMSLNSHTVEQYESNILLYPNPVSEKLYILNENSDAIIHISIKDVSGREVLSSTSADEIDMSSLNAGVYFVLIKSSKATSLHTVIKN